MKLLDCTLRDGGYYTDWDFDQDLVKDYLESMAIANVDYVELGMRGLESEIYKGPWAYTSDAYLSRIDLPVGPQYGVMIDAKEILEKSSSIADSLNRIFCEKSHSKISFVRVATHFTTIDECHHITKMLHDKGYIVALNLMQSAGRSEDLLVEVASKVAGWKSVDVLYFADSLGNMNREEVKRIKVALQMVWEADIGFHSHNNMGQAIDNCIYASEIGIEWLDCTMTGMGRGAGNAETEVLLERLHGCAVPESLLKTAINHFLPLKNKLCWGASPLYLHAAKNNVHPTFVQNILSKKWGGSGREQDFYGVISRLKNKSSYSFSDLSNALGYIDNQGMTAKRKLSSDPRCVDLFKKEALVLLANSPSVVKHRIGIELFVDNNNVDVVSLNIVEGIDSDIIDFYCITHNDRFDKDKDKYIHLGKPIILPRNRFNYGELEYLLQGDFVNYEMIYDESRTAIDKSGVHLKNDLTLSYILALAVLNGVRQIFLIGFDGYSDNERNKEVNEVLSGYMRDYGVQFKALTRSEYNVSQRSVYEYL